MFVLRALAMSLLMALGGPATAQTVKAGIEAWQRQDHAGAVEIWRPLAEAGDADAAFNLGQAYRLGRGVPLNLAAAQTWLERAARKDHLEAQSTLGLLLFDSGNRTGGLRWLKAAAEGGEARALLIYGTALFNGDGVPSDAVRAYAYVSRAAAQGLAPAKATLADLDKLMPLDQRQRGVALALDLANAKPAPKAAPAAAPAKAAAKPPAPAKVAPATAVAALSGQGWRIQLGAFSQRASAEALFRKLSARAPVAGKQAAFVRAGAVTRLQVGPFPTRSAAAAACAQLAKTGQACFPVAAR